MLKRWVASGLVESKNREYRFNLKKLGKTPLGKAMYDWLTLPYAERIVFQQLNKGEPCRLNWPVWSDNPPCLESFGDFRLVGRFTPSDHLH